MTNNNLLQSKLHKIFFRSWFKCSDVKSNITPVVLFSFCFIFYETIVFKVGYVFFPKFSGQQLFLFSAVFVRLLTPFNVILIVIYWWKVKTFSHAHPGFQLLDHLGSEALKSNLIFPKMNLNYYFIYQRRLISCFNERFW